MKRIISLLILSITFYTLLFSKNIIPQDIRKNPLVTYESINSWFIGISGGGVYHMSNNVFNQNLFKMFGPSFQIFVGKNFTPMLGARLSVNYSTVKSRASDELIDAVPSVFGDGRFDFHSLGLFGDGMVNLNNLFGRVDKSYKFNVIAFAGLGINRSFNFSDNINDWTWESDGKTYRYEIKKSSPFYLAIRGGFQFEYKVNPLFDLFLETSLSLTNDRWNGVVSREAEAYGNMGFGFIYKFKNNKKKIYNYSFISSDNLVYSTQKAPELISSDIVINNNLYTEPNDSTNKILDAKIKFNKKSSKIEESQFGNLEKVITYLKDNENKKIIIIGFGDLSTKNKEKGKNEKLAYERSSEVYDVLKKVPGILPDRILISFPNKMSKLNFDSEMHGYVIFIIKPNY